jgi:hypothetical protein
VDRPIVVREDRKRLRRRPAGGVEVAVKPLALAPVAPLIDAMMTLREPGCDTAEQHPDEEHRIDHKEQRHAEPFGHLLDRLERIEIDDDELTVGEREDDQQRRQRQQHKPADETLGHR